MRFRHALMLLSALVPLLLVAAAPATPAPTATQAAASATSAAAASGPSSTAEASGTSRVATASLVATTSVEQAGTAIVAMAAGDVRTGSGIIVGPGRVLTSSRVISKDPRVITTVMTTGGDLLPFRVLYHDDRLGLVLLEVNVPDVKQVVWGDSGKLVADEKVEALGIGSGNREVETLKGTVSAPPAATGNDLVLTDIKLDPLIEGGALVTPDGKLVGVVTAKSSDRVVGELGWAVTSKAARDFLAAYDKQQSEALATAARDVFAKWIGRAILLVFLVIVFFLGRAFRRWYKRMEAREEAAMAAEKAAKEAEEAERAEEAAARPDVAAESGAD